VVLALVAAACDRDPEGAVASRAGAQPIVVAQATRGRFVVERRFSGRVRAPGELRVVVREAGEVVEARGGADSQPVGAGDVLLRLRSPELELEVQEAEALLASAKVDLERQQRLVDLGLAARTELDGSRTAVEQARIRLERLRLRRRLLKVTAPASGVLLETEMPEPGQWCAAGMEVARIVDPASLVVEVAVPTAWSDHAREVQGAVVELGDSGERLADVLSLSADADPARGGRVLTLRPASTEGLVAGATLAVRLVVTSREEVVTVPVGALVADDDGGWRVALGPAVGEEGRIRWAPVLPGPSDGRRTVVEQGLEEGAWVVVANELSDTWWWGSRSFLGVGR
jgi:RND family efflux transporter MFP subunit